VVELQNLANQIGAGIHQGFGVHGALSSLGKFDGVSYSRGLGLCSLS